MKKITDKKEALSCFEESQPTCCLGDLSQDLQNDSEILFAYAKKWSTSAYQEKKEFFRFSRENMKKLLTTRISLDLLEDEDLEDVEYMKIAIMHHPDRLMQLFKSAHKDVLKKVIDKEMALHLVRIAGIYLGCLLAFQNDEDVVFEAISNDVRAIQYASPRIQCFLEGIIYVDEKQLNRSVCSIEKKVDEMKQLQAKVGALIPLQNEIGYLMQQISVLTEELEMDLQKIVESKQKVKEKMKQGKPIICKQISQKK